MSMFFDFMCVLEINEEIIKEFILNDIIAKNIIRNYNTLEEIIENNKGSNILNIVFDAFSLSLYMNDKYLIYKREDYNMNFDCHIHLDIYHDVQDWNTEIMKFLGCIMQNFNIDCVLEYYGDIILIRKNSKITVDESRTERMDKFPYDILGIEYFEEKIIID